MYDIHFALRKSNMDDLSSYIILPINTQFLPNIVSGPNIIDCDNGSSNDNKMYANIEYYVSPAPGIENVYSNSSEIQSGHFMSNDILDNNVANDITYRCSTCETVFDKYDLYIIHLQSHRNNTAFQCKKCNKTFDQKNCYHKHIMEHQEDKIFRCLICHQGFNIENNFKVHMVLHGNSSVCPICEISFQRMASLKSHLAIHQVEELLVCSECSSEFETVGDLKKHIKTHSLDLVVQHRDLTCNICKVKFETPILLKHHISSHLKVKKLVLNGKRSKIQMGKKEYKHKCIICSKTFPKLSLLDRHTRIHSGERPYVCSICDKGFTQKGTLQIHMTKHSGLKPFCCTLCPAKFNQKCNLKVHVQKTHTATTEDEKIFKCSQCDCIFRKVASLNGHMSKIHATDTTEITIASIDHPKNIDKKLLGHFADSSNQIIPQSSDNQLEMNARERLSEGEKISKIYSLKQKFLGSSKVYICSYCDKEIKKPSDLIRHLRTHTKEKPFKCFCGSSFSVKSTLLAHMQIHKGSNGKKCTVCSKVLFTLKSWNAHLRKHGSSSQTATQTIEDCQDETEKQLNPPVKPSDVEQQPVSLLKKGNLKHHIHLHSGDRKYNCRICKRSFITPFSLKEHIKLHSDVRKLERDTGNKIIATKSLLKCHMPINIAQKPYECFYCRKKFKNILMCGKHIKTHENNDVKQDILKASMSCVENEASVDETSSHVPESTTLLEVNPDEILDNLFDNGSKKITEECSNVDDTENLEKFTSVGSNTPLEFEKSEEMQTFFVDCPTNVHEEEELSNNFFSHLDLQPSNIIDLEPVDEMQEDTPMVFNVQNLIEEGSFPAVDMMNGELYMNNSSEETDLPDSQETKSLLRNVQKIMTSALNNTICISNDITENFLADNISLYPNTQIAFDKSGDITSTISSNLSPSQEAICLNITENPEKTAIEDSNVISLSFEESGCTTDNLNVIHCSECKQLFDNMTTYESHPCLKSILKNNSFDEVIDLDKSMKSSLNFLDTKNLCKNKSKSQKPVKKKFCCVYCSREFHSRGTYIRHANTHQKNDDGLHKCKFCIKKFKKPSDLSRHLRTHTGEKPYACDKCDKNFSLKSTLEGHYRTHNPGATKDFLCEVCNSFFTSKSSLKIHMHVHTGVKPHKCNYCDMYFRTLAHRRSHEQKIHSNGSSKNIQNKLNVPTDHSKIKNIIAGQNSEMTEPTEIKVHLSEERNQALSDAIEIDEVLLQQLQNSNIIIEVLHDIDPKEQSSVIAIDENTLGNLGLITATSKQPNEQLADECIDIESERNLECEICHKKYASKDVFRKHMQLHSKNKFICELCNKWFSTVEALCEHEKLHSGHRPYPCFLCTNNFAELQHLKSHLKRIHQIEDTSSQLIMKM